MLHRISSTIIALAVVLLCTGVALGQGADIPGAITSDENGYTYVTVSSVNSMGQTAIAVLVYDTDGNLWREFSLRPDPAGPTRVAGIDLIDSLIVIAGSGSSAANSRDIIVAGFARPGLLAVHPTRPVVGSFSLEQSYPNPLPPGAPATITYEVPVNSSVRLTLMDMAGREISLLAEGYHEKGRYELQYLPASLPDGSYFIVLSSDATLEVRKLMILR